MRWCCGNFVCVQPAAFWRQIIRERPFLAHPQRLPRLPPRLLRPLRPLRLLWLLRLLRLLRPLRPLRSLQLLRLLRLLHLLGRDFEFGMTQAFSGQTDGTSATQMARKP